MARKMHPAESSAHRIIGQRSYTAKVQPWQVEDHVDLGIPALPKSKYVNGAPTKHLNKGPWRGQSDGRKHEYVLSLSKNNSYRETMVPAPTPYK